MAESKRRIVVPTDVIVESLAACICCDEPDGEKYREETRYWLEQLIADLRGESSR